MKKLLLTSCLVVLCASSLKAEEVQQQANWKTNAAKYGWVGAKIGFVGLCAYNMHCISKLPWNLYPGALNVAHRNRNILITLVAAGVTAKSIYNDLTK